MDIRNVFRLKIIDNDFYVFRVLIFSKNNLLNVPYTHIDLDYQDFDRRTF